jgi:hypothetical protein
VWQIACVNQLTVRNIYFGAGADAEVAHDGYGSTAVHSLSRGVGSSGWIPVLRRNGRQRRGRAEKRPRHWASSVRFSPLAWPSCNLSGWDNECTPAGTDPLGAAIAVRLALGLCLADRDVSCR